MLFMPLPDIFSRLTQAWRRHWAGIMSADASAAARLAPELPATVFVTPPSATSRDGYAPGLAAPQRSARISSSNG
jgi:hypothetical protein